MNDVKKINTMDKEMVVSQLRYQTNRIADVVNSIEQSTIWESEYIGETIKDVESELRHLRRFIVD